MLCHVCLVGSLPNMLRTTSDCRRIIIAIEGEAFQRSGEIFDPEGGVGIIEFNHQEKTGIYTFVDFTKFNNR